MEAKVVAAVTPLNIILAIHIDVQELFFKQSLPLITTYQLISCTDEMYTSNQEVTSELLTFIRNKLHATIKTAVLTANIQFDK